MKHPRFLYAVGTLLVILGALICASSFWLFPWYGDLDATEIAVPAAVALATEDLQMPTSEATQEPPQRELVVVPDDTYSARTMRRRYLVFPVELEYYDPGSEQVYVVQPEYYGQQSAPQNTAMSSPPPAPGDVSADAFLQAGFSGVLAERLAANYPAYKRAQEETSLSWRVWAALHLMEHSALSDNPSNGEGPLGVTAPYGHSFPPGRLDVTSLGNALISSIDVVWEHVNRAQSVSGVSIDLNNTSDWERIQGEFAYTWNGRPASTVSPCNGVAYYGSSYLNSGYVAVGYRGQGPMYVRRSWGSMGSCDGWVMMERDGYLANFDKLLRVNP